MKISRILADTLAGFRRGLGGSAVEGRHWREVEEDEREDEKEIVGELELQLERDNLVREAAIGGNER